MDESTDSSLNRSSKRTRGPTTCKNLMQRTANKNLEKTIEFNEYGIPIGEWKNAFTSYVGAVVRQKVDINIESWDVVSEGLKNTIWQDIKDEWNIKDDEHKKRILKSGGKMWRDFKTRLRERQLLKGKDPCEKYDFIKRDQWEKFIRTHESDEFQEKSLKAKERQKFNAHPHFLGKGGYEAKRAKWLKEDPIASLSVSESIDTSIISDDCSGRGFDWLRARVKEKEGGGFYIPVESTREVFEKMVAWKGKIFEGSWVPNGHDDILARALGKKEHGGQVRGVGGGACIKDVFGSEKRTQVSGVVSMDQLTTITKRVREEYREELNEMQVKYNKEINEMHSKLCGILNHFKDMGMPLPTDNFGIELSNPTKELMRSSCQSIDPNPPDPFLNIENPTQCHLAVKKSSTTKLIVAKGTVFPSILPGAGTVHGEEIAMENVKVCVDDVLAEFKLTPLPVPSKELRVVGDASGSFVQWPKNLVLLGEDPIIQDNTKVPNQSKKVSSKGSTTHTQKREGLFIGDVKLNLSEECKYLHDLMMLPTDSVLINVAKDGEVFKRDLVKEQPVHVSRIDIAEFLKMSSLNISILQIFMMYIHKFCKELNVDEFGFMCPSALALVRDDPDLITTYMTDVMMDFKSKQFILAPYHQDNHWMLLLICCKENAVYIFNSLKKKQKIHIRGFLSVAYKIFAGPNGNRGSGGMKMNWYDVKCPQQRGGTECGYYVMRYMYDIVSQYHKNPKTKWIEGIQSERSYSHEQIDAIRDIWADYFTSECV